MTLPSHPFFIALQFLTIVPVHLKQVPDEKLLGRSLPYYPLVGAFIGGLLCAFWWGAAQFSGPQHAPLLAALTLTLWIVLTGGLHLDGLADSADALMGGLGERQKTLDIMKDPTSGPMGILALILVLLIKFAALWQLIGAHSWQALLVAPIMGRTALIALFLTTPYVRQNGLGAMIVKHMSRPKSIAVIGGVAFTAMAALPPLTSLSILLVSAIVLFCLRSILMHRLGGTTGDTAGALVELTETGVLVVMAFAG